MNCISIDRVFGYPKVPCGLNSVYAGLTAVFLWEIFMNNDDYNHTIEFRGRTYRYDPDMDQFYPVREQLSTWDQWGWIVVVIVLGFFTWLLTVVNN